MNRKFLDLTPTHYLCPYCGKWHEWALASGDMNGRIEIRCTRTRNVFTCDFSRNGISYTSTEWCSNVNQNNLTGIVLFSNFIENQNESEVITEIPIKTHRNLVSYCDTCSAFKIDGCIYCKLARSGDGQNMKIPFGFRFKKEEFDAIVEEERRANQEGNNMTTETSKKTTLKELLYENSPRRNFELLKEWAEKYKPTLKWVVPAITVYAAAMILKNKNSGLTVDNISKVCKEENGVTLGELKDKRKLNKLMFFGGTLSLLYGAFKFFNKGTSDKVEDVFVEDVEEGLNSLAAKENAFKAMQPMVNELLPVAIAVITAYALTQKKLPFGDKVNSKITDLKDKVGGFFDSIIDWTTMFLGSKFNIDLSSEEDRAKVRKFVLLGVIVAIITFLYGKKMLGGKHAKEGDIKEADKTLQNLTKRLLNIMKKLAPALFGVVIAGKFLDNLLSGKSFAEIFFGKDGDIVDGEAIEVEEETEALDS